MLRAMTTASPEKHAAEREEDEHHSQDRDERIQASSPLDPARGDIASDSRDTPVLPHDGVPSTAAGALEPSAS
jgi:hypothetical protein